MGLDKRVTVGCINLAAVVLSIPIIGAGIWLTTEAADSCVKILQWPVLILGILILLVGMAGFIGAMWRMPQLVILYQVGMLVLIALLLCLVVFTYMVTLRGHGNIQPNRSYLEYRTDGFSAWFRRRLRNWDPIKHCLITSNICADLNQSYRIPQDFFNAHLTPLQSGCCKPPTECGYTFVNPTYWISPINMGADMDCSKWSNDQTQLCFNCDSCKAGLLASLRKEWRSANLILFITLLALIVVYLISCFAFRNHKTHQLFSRYKQGYT